MSFALTPELSSIKTGVWAVTALYIIFVFASLESRVKKYMRSINLKEEFDVLSVNIILERGE